VIAGTTIDNIFTVDSNRTVPKDSNEVNVTTDQRGIAVAPVKTLRATDQNSNGDKDQAQVCIDVDCASSQTSDGGDTHSMWTLMTLMFFTGIIGLYYMRREENRYE